VYSLSLDEAGLPVLVMKRIEGVTWGQLLRDPAAMAKHAPDRPPLDEHLRILGQVCNAVHFAHARGVVHRDLKPDNVMVGAFGEVYVVDWGIATAFGPATQLAGTPAYMAPEMLGTPGARLSAKTDVYLLGAMLFEVLVGRAPHQVTSSTSCSARNPRCPTPSRQNSRPSCAGRCAPPPTSDPRARSNFAGRWRHSSSTRVRTHSPGNRCCAPPS
jgi:serine/threonine-protein kinase